MVEREQNPRAGDAAAENHDPIVNLLLTNDELHENRGGTQCWVAELAAALIGRGHRVAVLSWLRGPLAGEFEAAGVSVIGSAGECPFVPDLIHGQHHLATMVAVCGFPGVPAVYHCHGHGPWQEHPPTHPRIVRYVAMCEALVPWIAKITKADPAGIAVVPNTFDPTRFRKVRGTESRPRRAAVFGNSALPGHVLRQVERGCAAAKVSLDLLGGPFGRPVERPEDVLPGYDVVFAAGRSAIEAAASGCCVFPLSPFGCVRPLTPETWAMWRAYNFVPAKGVRAIDARVIRNELRDWQPRRVEATTQLVRSVAHFGRAVDQLEEIHRAAVDDFKARPDAMAEGRAVSDYLASLAQRVKQADENTAALRDQRDKARAERSAAKARIAALDDENKKLRKRLPNWLVRMWLR